MRHAHKLQINTLWLTSKAHDLVARLTVATVVGAGAIYVLDPSTLKLHSDPPASSAAASFLQSHDETSGKIWTH